MKLKRISLVIAAAMSAVCFAKADISPERIAELKTATGTNAYLTHACENWAWNLTSYSTFVERTAGPYDVLVCKAQIVDRTTGHQHVVGIVYNVANGHTLSMGLPAFNTFMQTGRTAADQSMEPTDLNPDSRTE